MRKASPEIPEAKFGKKIGIGKRPALLNVDTTFMFVDPAYDMCGKEDPALLAALERCGPFGVGNAQPRFALPAVKVAQASVVGENHVRCFLSGAEGGRLKAIAFRALDSDLGAALLQTAGLPLHLAGRLQIDRWGGVDSVQFIVEDAAQVRA